MPHRPHAGCWLDHANPHALTHMHAWLRTRQDVTHTIFKRLFRVYGHIYHSHFKQVRGEAGHLEGLKPNPM